MPVRIFGFSDLSDGPWGAAWIPPTLDQARLLGSAVGSSPATLQLEGEQGNEPWRLSTGGTELTVEGLGETVWSDPAGEASGFDQLCQVTGVLAGESGHRDVRSLGWRSSRPHPLSPSRVESLRQVAAWFDPEEGFALLAVRPKGGRGQERDQITAALFSQASAKPVADPRLSTTYVGSEQAARASVELWVEAEADSETQYPRRAIGEALAPPAQSSSGELVLKARPFHWYSAGREGAGIYLLGRTA